MNASSGSAVSELKIKTPGQAPLWKHALWAVVAVAGIWALSKIPSTLIVFCLAWLIAYLLNPVVDRLCSERLGPIKSCSRGQAVGIVAGLLLGAMVAAGAMIFPQLSDQVDKLISLQKSLGNPTELPMMLREKVEPILAKVPEKYREEVMTKATNLIQESAAKIGHWATQIITSIGAFLGQMLSAIFLVASAFLISLYMLMNWHNLAGDLLEKLPRQYQREVRSLSLKLNEIFGGYLKATILTAFACMIATYVSLFALELFLGQDFPYKGLVSFVAGIAYPIPVIGIIATSILGGVLGFVAAGKLGFGVWVLVTINVVNIFIDRTVQPRLMSDAIGVSELFVMFAAFAGGEVAGVWGMLLGIPVAAMGKTLFEWFHMNFLLVEEPQGQQLALHPLAEQPPASAPLSTEPTAPEPEPTPAPEPAPAPAPEPAPVPEPTPVPEPAPALKAEIPAGESVQVSVTATEPVTARVAEPDAPLIEPTAESAPEPVAEPAPESAPEPVAEPTPESPPEPVTEPAPESPPEPVTEPSQAPPASEPTAPTEPSTEPVVEAAPPPPGPALESQSKSPPPPSKKRSSKSKGRKKS